MKVLNKHIVIDECPETALQEALDIALSYTCDSKDGTLVITRMSADSLCELATDLGDMLYMILPENVSVNSVMHSLATARRYAMEYLVDGCIDAIIVDGFRPCTVEVLKGCISQANIKHNTYIETRYK